MNKIILLEVGEKFPINEEMAGIVPMASDKEQIALTDDIAANGLREPVVLWRKEIVDGRCRQKACNIAQRPIMAKELDDSLTEDEVRIFVKSVNTRRNLTATQKIISACKDSFSNKLNKKISEIAVSWGVSETLLKNARYIYLKRPEFIAPLFEGLSVIITSQNGTETNTNKVSAIYAHIKREEQAIEEDNQHGWKEDSNIKTQAGKDWYYKQIKMIKTDCPITKMRLAELANYKFTTENKSED